MKLKKRTSFDGQSGWECPICYDFTPDKNRCETCLSDISSKESVKEAIKVIEREERIIADIERNDH